MYEEEIKTAIYWILEIVSLNKLLPSEINEQLSYCHAHTHSWFQPFGLIGLTLITINHIGNGGAIEDRKKWEKTLRWLLLLHLMLSALKMETQAGAWSSRDVPPGAALPGHRGSLQRGVDGLRCLLGNILKIAIPFLALHIGGNDEVRCLVLPEESWVPCCGQWALTGLLGLSTREWEATFRCQTWHLYEKTAALDSWTAADKHCLWSAAWSDSTRFWCFPCYVVPMLGCQMHSSESGLLAGLCSLISARWWGSWPERDRCYHPGDNSSTSASPAQNQDIVRAAMCLSVLMTSRCKGENTDAFQILSSIRSRWLRVLDLLWFIANSASVAAGLGLSLWAWRGHPTRGSHRMGCLRCCQAQQTPTKCCTAKSNYSLELKALLWLP